MLIFGVEKCACAIFHAFCMPDPEVGNVRGYLDSDDDDEFGEET